MVLRSLLRLLLQRLRGVRHAPSTAAAALLLVLHASPALGEHTVVGPADGYAALEAAKAGDVVELLPGTYRFRVHLAGVGTAAEPIVIRAADPSQPPLFDLEGQPTEAWPGSWSGDDAGRGCWIVTGDHYVISGLSFRGCRTANGLGAGLRASGAGHVTLRDLRVADSDKGLFLGAESALVEFCEFERNGHTFAPSSHLFQTGGDITVRFCHFRDAVQGQDFYVEARSTLLEYNVFSAPEDYCGTIASNGVELAPRAVLRGNLFSLRSDPINGGQVIALYGPLGPSQAHLSFTAVWNTFVVRSDRNPWLLHIVNQDFGSVTATISNNVIAGTSAPYGIDRPLRANVQVSGRRNWLEPAASEGELTDAVGGLEPGFVGDGGATGFELTDSSAGAGAADLTAPEKPTFQFAFGPTGAPRGRARPSTADVGAFERSAAGALLGPYDAVGDGGSTTPQDAGARGGDAGPTPLSLRLACDCSSSSAATFWLLTALGGLAMARRSLRTRQS
jgi:hypothetical protein